MTGYAIVTLAAVLGWFGGMVMGRWGEARLWREAGKYQRLKESNGMLFRVTEGAGATHWN